MAGDAVRLLCLCGDCTNDTARVQYCLQNAVVTAVLKQHLNFYKHSVWSSASELPASSVANQEGR